MSNNFLYSILCLVVFSGGLLAEIVYKDCPKAPAPVVGKINSIAVSGCSQSPCELKKGSNYTISVNFTISEDAKQAIADVHGVVAGVPVEFPLPQKNACESGLSCPLKKQATYMYKATLPILDAYPAISVVVEWALNDASSGGKTIFCFETPIKVVA